MNEVTAGELSNDVRDVLARVEAGERLLVTVDGRQVAVLVPPSLRRQSLSWEQFVTRMGRAKADPGLAAELSDLVPDTTDDVDLA